MNKKQRVDFRKSKAWKEFRYKCRLRTSRDYITKQPLAKDWNLHHLDLNVRRYDVLVPDKFMPLNFKTHEIIHELYSWYKKDRKVLDRIKEVLERMETLTNES